MGPTRHFHGVFPRDKSPLAPPVTSGEIRDTTASRPYRGNPIHRRNHALSGVKNVGHPERTFRRKGSADDGCTARRSHALEL